MHLELTVKMEIRCHAILRCKRHLPAAAHKKAEREEEAAVGFNLEQCF